MTSTPDNARSHPSDPHPGGATPTAATPASMTGPADGPAARSTNGPGSPHAGSTPTVSGHSIDSSGAPAGSAVTGGSATADTATAPDDPSGPGGPETSTVERPGWPEIGAGAGAFVLTYVLGAIGLWQIPDNALVAQGLAAYALSAILGLAVFGAAYAVRIRRAAAFGLRRVAGKWLVVGFGLGLVGFALNIAATFGYMVFTGDASTPQGGYRAAGAAGIAGMLATLALGAVATPIGEELAFRGVLANALNRYGWWAGVLVSSVVFALSHGLNIVFPAALIVGLAAAILLRRTGSVWPGVVVHATNNALSVVVPLIAAASTA